MKTKTIKLNLAWLIAFLSRGRILLRVCNSNTEKCLLGGEIPNSRDFRTPNKWKTCIADNKTILDRL